MEQKAKNGMARLAIIEKETQEFIGWTGIKFEENLRFENYYDLGYRLKKKFWGKGIASETAKLSLKHLNTKPPPSFPPTIIHGETQ